MDTLSNEEKLSLFYRTGKASGEVGIAKRYKRPCTQYLYHWKVTYGRVARPGEPLALCRKAYSSKVLI